jgi:hypothetical protein
MIKVERDTDAKRINAILNHPVVRPDVDEVPEGPLDISSIVADPRHVVLMGEYGGCVCMKLLPGVYEVHTQAVPEGRGAWIVEFVRAGADWMFTHTDAFEIVTRVPEDHLGARMLSRAAGMKLEFERPAECRWRGKPQRADIYSYRIQDWAKITTGGYVEAGERFHDFLHEEAARLGVTAQAHPDDPNHNRYVGISLAMLEGGQVYKALNFYNRWALVSRHPIIRLIKELPLTVQFDIGNLVFENGTKRVELMDAAA